MYKWENIFWRLILCIILYIYHNFVNILIGAVVGLEVHPAIFDLTCLFVPTFICRRRCHLHFHPDTAVYCLPLHYHRNTCSSALMWERHETGTKTLLFIDVLQTFNWICLLEPTISLFRKFVSQSLIFAETFVQKAWGFYIFLKFVGSFLSLFYFSLPVI